MELQQGKLMTKGLEKALEYLYPLIQSCVHKNFTWPTAADCYRSLGVPETETSWEIRRRFMHLHCFARSNQSLTCPKNITNMSTGMYDLLSIPRNGTILDCCGFGAVGIQQNHMCNVLVARLFIDLDTSEYWKRLHYRITWDAFYKGGAIQRPTKLNFNGFWTFYTRCFFYFVFVQDS